ncbi:MAG: molybdate ABC transporter permease subunit [Lachnospiraceae bacterium]|nr:molybdate ABC transporter permease subunit [Lachnospiraceae bacterium]
MDLSPLWISLKVAFPATALALILGLSAARLVSGSRKWKYLWDSLFSLPLVLPPTVVGFFLLIVFGKNTPVGRMLTSIGIDIIFTPAGAVIAACVVSFPIIYRTVRGAFENIDTELVDVARIYGCSEMSILFRIYIPLCWQEIAAGTIIAFARAIGEFGATVMIAGNIPGRTRTMSVAVYTAMQSGNRAEAYRWVCLILLLSVAVLLILNFWSGIQFTSDPDVFRKKKKNLPEAMKE